jgi:hypothetical protein
MTTKCEDEYQELALNANVNLVDSFGNRAPQAPMRENLQDGDILTFPSDLTGKVAESKIRNSDKTASYILVDVKRGDKKLVVPFYPSYLWKMRMEYDPKTKMPTGVRHRTSGNVTEFIQDFETLDEAFLAIAKKGKVVATLKPENCFKTMPYGGEDGIDSLQNCKIFDYNWLKE